MRTPVKKTRKKWWLERREKNETRKIIVNGSQNGVKIGKSKIRWKKKIKRREKGQKNLKKSP